MKYFLTAIITLLGLFLLTSPAQAQVDIDLGVPSGQPIFVLENMLPGDQADHSITVTNFSPTPTDLQVVCSEIEELKNFSAILDFIIQKDGTDIYGGTTGAKTVADFCNAAQTGFNLGSLPPNSSIIYTFKVTFPANAGNEYQQAKYVFDLIFQTQIADNLVINEVYYQVDPDHGLDCKKDRLSAINSNNGAGSSNIIDIHYNNSCFIVQNNQSTITNNISSSSNNGNNSISNNTSSSNTITTGNANSSININVISNYNVQLGSCTQTTTNRNDEWVELYNPTNQRISLRGWSLMDNSGQLTTISSNTRIRPGGFALISRTKATWRNWDEPRTPKVKLGTDIGDGLDNAGDHLYLIDPNGNQIDFTAWGNDTTIWDPAVSSVPLGSSIERLTPGFDTNTPQDWQTQAPPTPGE